MQYILWGGTGQAKVVRPILADHELIAVFDNAANISPFDDVHLVGGDSQFDPTKFRDAGFVATIGGTNGRVRADKSIALASAGLHPLSPVHRMSFVAASARVGRGCQIMALAAISEEAVLGDWCIINTMAIVDHECRLGIGVHVMPGATLTGLVDVGDYATVGAGATILPGLKIGRGAVVGAGAVVTRNVEDGATVVGNPANKTVSL